MQTSHAEKLAALKQKRIRTIHENKSDLKQEPTVKNVKVKHVEKQELDEKTKNLLYSIEDNEEWNEKIAKKQEKEQVGFSSFDQLAVKKFNKLSDKITPDLEKYKQDKELGPLLAGGLSSKSVEKMVSDLDAQLDKRRNLRRRRVEDGTDDVDFINERNRQFNKKAARAYNEYTKEIKASLERGTAL